MEKLKLAISDGHLSIKVPFDSVMSSAFAFMYQPINAKHFYFCQLFLHANWVIDLSKRHETYYYHYNPDSRLGRMFCLFLNLFKMHSSTSDTEFLLFKHSILLLYVSAGGDEGEINIILQKFIGHFSGVCVYVCVTN